MQSLISSSIVSEEVTVETGVVNVGTVVVDVGVVAGVVVVGISSGRGCSVSEGADPWLIFPKIERVPGISPKVCVQQT